MITKTFICDKCKKSVGETELVQLTMSAKILKTVNGYVTQQTANKDICINCLKEKGIVTELKEETYNDDIAKNNKTMNDKIIDFLQDLGVLFEQ